MVILSEFGLVELSGKPFCYIEKFTNREQAENAFIKRLADLDGRLPSEDECPSEVWDELTDRYGTYAEAGEYADKDIDLIMRLFEPDKDSIGRFENYETGQVYDVSALVDKDTILLELKQKA